MKTIKRSIALVLAMILTLAMSVTVFAAPNADQNTFSLTLNKAVKGHTYEAYQILSGDLSADKATLSNIKWGEGITEAGQTALGGDAASYAEKLGGFGNNSSELKEQAQIQGYTVVEASTVVATHLNHLISQHAAELFGRQEAQQLLDRVAQEMPKLTEDLVPGVVTLTTLHKVLQNLLDEKVTIRDMRTILETLAEHAPIQSDPHELTAVVRVALGRAITQQWFPGKDEVHVIGLDTPLERLLLQALQGGGGLEPGLADRLLAQTQEALSRQEMLGAPPVLLVNHALRPLLSRFLRRSLPQLVVLSNLELSDNRHIRMTATIGGK